MKTTVCQKCGNVIGEGKWFCTSCGTRVSAPARDRSSRIQTETERMPQQARHVPLHSGNTTVSESNMSRFATISIGSSSSENVFLKKTYSFFLLAVISIFVTGYFSFHFIPEKYWITLGALDSAIWVMCGWFGWRHPIAISFTVFTVITGLFLGALANFYSVSGMADIFVHAAIITVMAFSGLTAYIFVTRRDFNWLLGFLNAGFWILLGSFYLYAVTQASLLRLAIDIFGIIVFTGWILFDTSRILNRRNIELTPPIAAFELFLDIIGLFSYILDFLDWRNWFD